MTVRRAFYSPEVFVCEASAGSGKTYALAERYVRLILFLSRNGGRPPVYSILAITFTNKAAFEMKERIIRFLKELALGVMDFQAQSRMVEGLGMDDQQVRLAAARVIDEIFRSYHYFQVQTIDRFINTLLMSSAFQIGLDSSFKIKTDTRAYFKEAVDELINEARANAAVKQAFDDLLTSLLLVEARSAWMPKEVVEDTVRELFNEYNTYARPFIRGHVTPDEIWRAKIKVVDDVRLFVENMPEGIHKTVEKSLRKFVDSGRRAFLFSKDLSAYFARDAEDIEKFKLSGWHADQWARIRRGFKEAAEMEVRHLYDPYVELFERAREKLEKACVRDNVMFLGELNAKARLIDEKGLAPQELYYRLSTRFEHYLFDEFQDTSRLQWDNLKALPEDAIARGGSLFYVGDKKQAIFSFRGGDTFLFDAVRSQYADSGYHPYTHILTESRRSHKSVVDFNNAVFAMDNLQRLLSSVHGREKDAAELARIYGSAVQVPLKLDPPGLVRVQVLAGKTQEEAREESLAKTVHLLQELHSRFSWKDIGILVRKNSDVAVWTRALLEAGIPAASERTLNIKEHPRVLEMVSFLKFLNDPQDNEAFARAVLGDIFERAAGIPRQAMEQVVLQWRQARQPVNLYEAFKEAFPGVWQNLIQEFYQKAGLYPVYELLMSIYYRWDVLSGDLSSQGFLMHWLELVRAKENDYPSLSGMLEYFEENDGDDFYAAAASGVDAVRIATIHKAKGLEYRVAVLPFFTFGLDRSGARASHAPKYVLRQEAEGQALYHFNETHTRFSSLADAEYVEEKMAVFFNELNNAYVALTRAVCEMYVFMPPKSGSAVNMALQLVPMEIWNLGELSDAYPSPKAKDEGALVVVEPPECRDWLTFLQDEFITREDWLAQQERSFGVALHDVLSRIKVLEPAGLDRQLEEAFAFVPPAQADALRGIVRDFLLSPAAAKYFIGVDHEVLTEHELVDRLGVTRRLDRVLVGAEEITVIDFKTSRAPDISGEKAQVRQYMDLLTELYPGKAVRGVLLFVKEREALDV